MSTLRLPYYDLSPKVYGPLLQILDALAASRLGAPFIELIYLRVSQINGCAFCLEKHSIALRGAGISQIKLDTLAGWRVSTHFTPRERAALAWAESVTAIGETHAPDEVYLPLQNHFSPEEISDLTFAISIMNALNRMAISMRL